jgi:hypothetical protein
MDYGLWGWMKSQVYEMKLNTRDKLLARIFDAAARIKERHDQLRRTTRDFCKRAAKCIEVEGGIFENLLLTVINLFFCIYCTPFKVLMLKH